MLSMVSGEGRDSELVAMLLFEEARNCRVEAERFAGKAEAPFLLHLAEAFEELAGKEQLRVKLRQPCQRN